MFHQLLPDMLMKFFNNNNNSMYFLKNSFYVRKYHLGNGIKYTLLKTLFSQIFIKFLYQAHGPV